MQRRSNGSARAEGIEHAHICVRMRAQPEKKNSGDIREKTGVEK
jgi:hypothetical protein